MRLKKIENWESKKELNCMLFFAQLLDEMLFNYTLDSYKSPALNTNTLCDEALAIISEINKNVISKGAIIPILDELIYNLKTDLISDELFGFQLEHYCKKLKNHSDLQVVSATILLIKQTFQKGSFLLRIIEKLKEKIVENKEKEKIYILSRIYVTELINSGYDMNFVYNRVIHFFFNKSAITSIDQLDDFFNQFDFKKKKFKITFFATRLYHEIREASKNMGLDVTDSIDTSRLNPPIKKYIENINGKKLFVTIESVEIDYHSAFKDAERKIEKVACLFNFFHHKNRLDWKPKILIVNSETNDNILIAKPDSSILNCKDLRPKHASKDLKNTIKNFSLTHDSFRRIDKSLDLHSYALNTDTIENQIINLWTSFETLIPKKENINKDRIIQLLDVIVPFQCIDYVKKLIQYIQKSLIEWNFQVYKNICKTVVEGTDTLEQFGAFVVLEKYDSLRTEVYSKLLAENYLSLTNRIFHLNKTLSTVSSVQDLLNGHKSRINWHIQRIYRTRNLVVHSGSLFPFASVLIENIHSYFDLTIKQIFKLAIEEKKIDTLEQAFVETEVRLNYHMDYLEKNRTKKTDENNFKNVLFGIN